MAEIEIRGVTKSLGGHTILDDVSLDVEKGEMLVLVGASGSGKSTLLRVLAGLVHADAGELRFAGRLVNDLEPRERDVAMVFQNYALYPHKTVRENLAFPLRMRGVAGADRERDVRATAALLGLEALLDRRPHELSGEQMQRVALGRALIRKPRLFLFDEPLSNLDARLRLELRAEIARLQAELGVTAIYVTHDQAEAMTLGARLCLLDRGRVVQIGTPLEVFREPRSTLAASFLGSPPMNLVEGVVADGIFRVGELTVPAPAGASPGRRLVLGIRPHEVELGGGLALRARHVEALGDRVTVELDLDGKPFRVQTRSAEQPRPGEEVRFGLPRAALLWFDAGTGLRWPSGRPPDAAGEPQS